MTAEALFETPSARRDRPGSRSFPVVIGVFAGLLALGVLVAYLIHDRFIGFERIVANHVPDDATLVVRWDVEKVTLFEPTRRFLLPLLDETPSDDLDPGERSRRRRLARRSGLEIGRDLREVLAVFGPGASDWAVVSGGSFPKTGVADAVERVLADEGRAVRRIGDERLETPGGIAFGRATDGALVLASSRSRLEAVLGVHPPDAAIPRTGAGALLVRGDAGVDEGLRGIVAELGDASRVEAVATWGSPLVVDATIHYRDRRPEDALPRARRVLGRLLGPGAVPQTDVVNDPPGPPSPRLTVRIRLDDDALERGLRRARDSIYGTLWREREKAAAP